MKSSGNGHPEQCAINLLKITRGEVPYDRIKGRDATIVDAPISSAISKAEDDAEWLLSEYEPRISIDNIDISAILSNLGDLDINANIIVKKEKWNE